MREEGEEEWNVRESEADCPSAGPQELTLCL